MSQHKGPPSPEKDKAGEESSPPPDKGGGGSPQLPGAEECPDCGNRVLPSTKGEEGARGTYHCGQCGCEW